MSPKAGCLLINEIVPRLQAAIPRTVRMVGPEDSQEVIQDAIAMAAKLLHNSVRNGKSVTSGNITFYCIQSLKSGRRTVGYSTADVLAAATQLRGRAKLHSFDEPIAQDESNESLCLLDIFTNQTEDVAGEAARNLDWAEVIRSQSPRGRAILQCMDEGRALKEVARRFGVSSSAIHRHKEKIAAALVEFMGADILKQINRGPQWKDNIHASREKVACRFERQAA